jgi:hypothetical protein
LNILTSILSSSFGRAKISDKSSLRIRVKNEIFTSETGMFVTLGRSAQCYSGCKDCITISVINEVRCRFFAMWLIIVQLAKNSQLQHSKCRHNRCKIQTSYLIFGEFIPISHSSTYS